MEAFEVVAESGGIYGKLSIFSSLLLLIQRTKIFPQPASNNWLSSLMLTVSGWTGETEKSEASYTPPTAANEEVKDNEEKW